MITSLLASFLVTLNAIPQESATASPIQVLLDNAIKTSPAVKQALVSITVTDAAGTTLFSHNSDMRLMPASNQKLLSTAFAVDSLGMEFRPRTRIWEDASRITIDATGDPSMTLAKIQEAAGKLKSKNKPVFLRQAYAPGIPESWEVDDLPNRFAAPVYAFSFDQGAFSVRWNGTEIEPFPKEFGLKIRNSDAPGFGIKYDFFQELLRYSGKPSGPAKVLDTLAFRYPDQVAARFFGSSLIEAFEVPTTPPDITIEGDGMGQLLANCLQPSDNNYAENLLLMGASAKGPLSKGSEYALARTQLTNFLVTKVGVDPADIRVYDGSGLSRHNIVTTRLLAKLLHYSQSQPWGAAYEAGFAKSGVGTLKTRLQASSFRGKTGTLDMVVGLSGFLTTTSGEKRIVSILINHAAASSANVRDFADGIIKTIESQ